MVYLEECELIVRDYLGAGLIYVDESDSNDESMIIKKFSRSFVLSCITYVYCCNKTDNVICDTPPIINKDVLPKSSFLAQYLFKIKK